MKDPESVLNGTSDINGSNNSHQRTGPFEPKYIVKVPDAVKNGEVLQFTIKVYKVIKKSKICCIRVV